MSIRLQAPATLAFVCVLLSAPPLFAHHEAIFGPQSAALLSKKRYVAAQYYFANEGLDGDKIHSNIGILSAGAALTPRWGTSVSLPFEIQGGNIGAVQGLHDPVLGIRYSPDVGENKNLIGTLTIEPPATSLEVRSFGMGAGALYSAERGHWSGNVYALGRTEHSFEQGRRRGNRLFIGGGLAFEAKSLPFSPQLGISYERTGAKHENGLAVSQSLTSAIMLHPTVVKTFRDERIQTFLVISVPAVQWSGVEGWQRYRIASGVIFSF